MYGLQLTRTDYASLSGAADAWELESFGPTGSQIFSQVQSEQNALRAAAKSLTDSVSQLRNCVSKPGPCQSVYQTLVGTLVGTTLGAPLVYIYTNDGTGTSPTQTTRPASPPAAAPTDPSERLEWLITTAPDTSLKDFQAFIKELPDRGSGRQITFPTSDNQAYITKMTELEAEIANLDPIVDVIVSNEPLESYLFFLNSTGPAVLDRRAGNPTIVAEAAQRYQQLLSAPQGQDLTRIPDKQEELFYAHEESAGDGTFVYVLDCGFRFSHQVCSMFLQES